VHNSNLNYQHILQCNKVGWKITCVSLVEFPCPMQEIIMKFKHQGTVDCQQNIEMPGFKILANPKLVWNSWNSACYHGAASTCRGKKFVQFGAGAGISFSQTRASHNKHDGFYRERPTFGDETISIASYCVQKFSNVNIEQQECCVNFLIFRGSFGHLYSLTRFSRHFMCIIQI